jgi:NAD(P)-dependent dehydrogenase (short-subunit alcohol dehydrogenase family)
MQLDITGSVALVTGSAHRVGKAIALELARRGANIVIHYHRSDEATVRDTVQDMKSLGVETVAIQADVSTPDGVTELFSGVVERFNRLDILVNSASIFQPGGLLNASLDDWNRSLSVNTTGPFLCTQAAAEIMAKNSPPGGAIVNILDRGAIMPWQVYAHHGVSKAALWMLTQTSAVELGPDVRVNAVLPGPVMQPDDVTGEEWAATGNKTLLKRTGTPEDVARAVAYLVTESFITGTLIHVNGGRHLAV